MMDDYKNFDNFQRTEGCKMISPHHSHPTNGPSDSIGIRGRIQGYSVCGNVCAVKQNRKEDSVPERI